MYQLGIGAKACFRTPFSSGMLFEVLNNYSKIIHYDFDQVIDFEIDFQYNKSHCGMPSMPKHCVAKLLKKPNRIGLKKWFRKEPHGLEF